MALPELPRTFDIDFSKYDLDLITNGLNRMLDQHIDKCVLRKFLSVFVNEAQQLYDACVDMQRLRVLANASGENLNAIARIVGAERTPWEYTEENWLYFDRQGQSFDQIRIWCWGGRIGDYGMVDDPQFRMNILQKIIKNHTLVASVPEAQWLIEFMWGTGVSFEKTGPMEIRLIIEAHIPMTQLVLLTWAYDNETVDHAWYVPWPATLSISEVLIFGPRFFFLFDRVNRGWDIAPMAVSTTLSALPGYGINRQSEMINAPQGAIPFDALPSNMFSSTLPSNALSSALPSNALSSALPGMLSLAS